MALSLALAGRPASAEVPQLAPPGAGLLLEQLRGALPFELPMTPPEPVRFVRKTLSLNFAVLLMRSGEPNRRSRRLRARTGGRCYGTR